MTTLIFIRHGQSECNLQRVFTGHSNVSLTPLGKRQAENTANFLKDQPIEVIYSSDLLRSMQTAEPTARMHQLPIVPNRNLREIFAGEWEGKKFEELLQKYPQSYETWRCDCGNACPDGGESVLALSKRIYQAVDEILESNRGKCVAVFTHATPIRLLRARWEGYAVSALSKVAFCGNASVSIVDYNDDNSFSVRLCCYDGHQGADVTELPRGVV